MKRISQFTAGGFRLVDALMAIGMLVMTAMVFANVVLRYGFESGILGSIEVSRFLFVWIIMLGAVGCLRLDEHLQLMTFVQRMAPPVRRFVLRLGWALILLCCVMLAVGSLRQTIANWGNAQPMSGISIGLVYFSGVVGGVLMALIALYRQWRPEAVVEGDKSVGDIA
jgi:TRAP-type C4-dicarboxylate transport system permease small subunit